MKAFIVSGALLVLFAGSAMAEPNGNAWGYWRNHPRNDQPAPAIPEPTGALLFGAGLLAASAASRRLPR